MLCRDGEHSNVQHHLCHAPHPPHRAVWRRSNATLLLHRAQNTFSIADQPADVHTTQPFHRHFGLLFTLFDHDETCDRSQDGNAYYYHVYSRRRGQNRKEQQICHWERRKKSCFMLCVRYEKDRAGRMVAYEYNCKASPVLAGRGGKAASRLAHFQTSAEHAHHQSQPQGAARPRKNPT